MKPFKIGLITLMIVAIASGAIYMLMVTDVIPAPGFIKSLPVIGKPLQGERLSSEDKLRQEYSKLQEDVKQRDNEINKLQARLNEAEQELKRAEALNKELQKENESLAVQIEELQSNRRNQESVYKDMAKYFAEMKPQEAADLLSRQKDEDIIGVLEQMETSQAADILQRMDREKAAAITRQMMAVSP
ncbi:MAG TPA: hypothetical protein PLG09_01095 [Syntrophomonadaceae bacterium]|nr:hypothetical protein [Syntrophomonadaceae bacterium]HOQ08700.1 hypothetical protein [Syntrophomonadaceae bacterium]HPU48709.1 hypothetical protein [Syntrophomonadaceae bacterium]